MSLFATRQPIAIAVSIGVGVGTLIMPIHVPAHLPDARNPSTSNTPTTQHRLDQQDLEYTRYVDAKTGTAITYPGSIFSKSEESTDQFTKFISSDKLATFYLISRYNDHNETIADLSATAEDALAEEKALITYRRAKQDWFVLSGFINSKIFYRKTVLSNDGKAIVTFQINFPKSQKPFYYDIVERMSWSFKPR
jgi:hypothetical protein